jgi:hypothetical protein
MVWNGDWSGVWPGQWQGQGEPGEGPVFADFGGVAAGVATVSGALVQPVVSIGGGSVPITNLPKRKRKKVAFAGLAFGESSATAGFVLSVRTGGVAAGIARATGAAVIGRAVEFSATVTAEAATAGFALADDTRRRRRRDEEFLLLMAA